MVMAPSRERTLYNTGQVTIFDYQLGKGLELSPSEKKAALVNIANLPKELATENLLETFREFPQSPQALAARRRLQLLDADFTI